VEPWKYGWAPNQTKIGVLLIDIVEMKIKKTQMSVSIGVF
jgi:hypothetical protein